MSLSNRVLRSSASETWDTPMGLFKRLNEEFKFTLDACAQPHSAKCKKFFSPEDDGLSQDWEGVVFMNPPYGRSISKWVSKARSEADKGATVVCLVPSRTDTKWFHSIRGELRFFSGRLKFENRNLPSWREDGNFKISPAPFPSLLIVMRPGDTGKALSFSVKAASQ